MWQDPGRIPPDVIAQLRFLRGALERGAGEEMQQLFPEGFFSQLQRPF
jgi:hypothetical protein